MSYNVRDYIPENLHEVARNMTSSNDSEVDYESAMLSEAIRLSLLAQSDGAPTDSTTNAAVPPSSQQHMMPSPQFVSHLESADDPFSMGDECDDEVIAALLELDPTQLTDDEAFLVNGFLLN